MFGLGVQEILLILLALVLLFGAKKIPELARGIGRGMSEFRKGVRESPDDSKKESEEIPQPSQEKPDNNRSSSS